MALLNFEEEYERKWKIQIAKYLKMKRKYKEDMKKEEENKLKERKGKEVEL